MLKKLIAFTLSLMLMLNALPLEASSVWFTAPDGEWVELPPDFDAVTPDDPFVFDISQYPVIPETPYIPEPAADYPVYDASENIGMPTFDIEDVVPYDIYGAVPYADAPTEGQCGDNAYWSYDNETRILTITGSGDMYDFGYGSGGVPWDSVRWQIVGIVVSEGITSIGESAFNYCYNAENIELPQSLTKIGDSAFSGCSKVTSLTLSSSIQSIGKSAFGGCSKLESIELPNGLTEIPDNMLRGCHSLVSINIPSTVKTIGTQAFYGCRSVESIVLPTGLTEIGRYAFEECTSLFIISIPSTVKSVEYGAFEGCTSLTSASLPDGLTGIPNSMFEGCSSLQNVNIPSTVTTIGSRAFESCKSLSTVVLPAGLTSIGSDAFKNAGLIAVDLPAGIEQIGSCAFFGCKMASVFVPAAVTGIGEGAFSNCPNLVNITVSNDRYYVTDGILFERTYAGSQYSRIHTYPYTKTYEEYTLTNDITGICGYAFYANPCIKKVVIPEGVTSIGDYAFYNCTVLEKADLPKSLRSIGRYAFGYCSALTDPTLPDSVTTIGYSAYIGSGLLGDLVIPDSVTSLGGAAYAECRQLTSVETSVATINSNTFAGCPLLVNVNLKSGVKIINSYAFDYYYYSNITPKAYTIYLPATLQRIEYNAFPLPYGVTTSQSVVYYEGCQDAWNNISIETNNENITLAEIHVNDHKFGYLYDGDNHWMGCIYCGLVQSSPEPHTWNDMGDCTVCDADKAMTPVLSKLLGQTPDQVLARVNKWYPDAEVNSSISSASNVVVGSEERMTVQIKTTEGYNTRYLYIYLNIYNGMVCYVNTYGMNNYLGVYLIDEIPVSITYGNMKAILESSNYTVNKQVSAVNGIAGAKYIFHNATIPINVTDYITLSFSVSNYTYSTDGAYELLPDEALDSLPLSNLTLRYYPISMISDFSASAPSIIGLSTSKAVSELAKAFPDCSISIGTSNGADYLSVSQYGVSLFSAYGDGNGNMDYYSIVTSMTGAFDKMPKTYDSMAYGPSISDLRALANAPAYKVEVYSNKIAAVEGAVYEYYFITVGGKHYTYLYSNYYYEYNADGSPIYDENGMPIYHIDNTRKPALNMVRSVPKNYSSVYLNEYINIDSETVIAKMKDTFGKYYASNVSDGNNYIRTATPDFNFSVYVSPSGKSHTVSLMGSSSVYASYHNEILPMLANGLPYVGDMTELENIMKKTKYSVAEEVMSYDDYLQYNSSSAFYYGDLTDVKGAENLKVYTYTFYLGDCMVEYARMNGQVMYNYNTGERIVQFYPEGYGRINATTIYSYTPDTTVAYAVDGGNIYFDPASGMIVSADADVSVAEIPEKINGVDVVGIAAGAFEGTNIKEIHIPSSVSYIGNNAFAHCDQLADLYYEGSESNWADIGGNSSGVTASTTCHFREFEIGDLNGDGKVNITDAIELLKYIAKLDNNVVNEAGTDIDGNGTVNINDAIQLLKIIAKLV